MSKMPRSPRVQPMALCLMCFNIVLLFQGTTSSAGMDWATELQLTIPELSPVTSQEQPGTLETSQPRTSSGYSGKSKLPSDPAERERILKQQFEQFLKQIWRQKYFHTTSSAVAAPLFESQHHVAPSGGSEVEQQNLIGSILNGLVGRGGGGGGAMGEWGKFHEMERHLVPTNSKKNKDKKRDGTDGNEPRRYQNQCRTIRTQIQVSKEETSPEDATKIERVCEAIVEVNKCEGVCLSNLRPSVNVLTGLLKECICCREGSLHRKQVQLNVCFDRNGNQLSGDSMEVTIMEPKDCACSSCS